jgi:hypothetical protein
MEKGAMTDCELLKERIALLEQESELLKAAHLSDSSRLMRRIADMAETVMKVEIDEIPYYPESALDKEAKKLLREVYLKIWQEACLDPTNPISQKFATSLLSEMSQANDILHFHE